MGCVPVARDVGAARQPDVVAGDVLEEAAQGRRAARSPDDAAVESDGHHPPTLAPKLIERVDQILGELLAVTKPFTSRNLKSFASSV